MGGKSHIAVALAVVACRAGYSIYFTSLDDGPRPHHRRSRRRLTSKFGRYLRPAVLVSTKSAASPSLAPRRIWSSRSSQTIGKGLHHPHFEQNFSEWGQVFGDEVLAAAILDRLLHHCRVISINDPSYRLKNRLAASNANEPTRPEVRITGQALTWQNATDRGDTGQLRPALPRLSPER
ncbi:ATP-binding protein [Streptomyces sp. NPDC046876]|uniref:ATP-binding protein n=1 Tax=Streptomyces sp. NPDC046876 TaxID=3155616 RepID=UPI00340C262A